MNRSRFFENTILSMLQAKQSVFSPLFLGGGSGGGGGPPAGIVGQLAQSYVTYDAAEAVYPGTNSPSSLKDNLAHIRNQLKNEFETAMMYGWWGLS
jgi:hypothetical protein